MTPTGTGTVWCQLRCHRCVKTHRSQSLLRRWFVFVNHCMSYIRGAWPLLKRSRWLHGSNQETGLWVIDSTAAHSFNCIIINEILMRHFCVCISCILSVSINKCSWFWLQQIRCSALLLLFLPVVQGSLSSTATVRKKQIHKYRDFYVYVLWPWMLYEDKDILSSSSCCAKLTFYLWCSQPLGDDQDVLASLLGAVMSAIFKCILPFPSNKSGAQLTQLCILSFWAVGFRFRFRINIWGLRILLQIKPSQNKLWQLTWALTGSTCNENKRQMCSVPAVTPTHENMYPSPWRRCVANLDYCPGAGRL